MNIRRSFKFLSAITALAVSTLGTLLPVTAASAAPSNCATAGVTVAPIHGTWFFVDSNKAQYDAGYLGYSVKGTNGFSNLGVSVNLNGPVKLGGGQPSSQPYGSLASAATGYSYFLATAPKAETTQNTNITVTITDGVNTVCTFNDQLDGVHDRIEANANKIYYGSVTPDPTSIVGPGTIAGVTVYGNTGTIGAGPFNNNEINFAAVAQAASFHAATWELKDINFRSSNTSCGVGGLLAHKIHWETGQNGFNVANCQGTYTTVFTYKVRDNAPNEAQDNPSVVQGYSWIASGSNIKHTDPWAGLNLPVYNINTPPTINTGNLPDGKGCVDYSAFLSASLGNGQVPEVGYGWKVVNGSLPIGFTLNPQTGEIAGKCTVPGTYYFTVRLTDTNGMYAQKALRITINSPAPPTITTSSLPSGIKGQPYSAQLAATAGDNPIADSGTVWRVYSGTLPAGLSLNPTTGAITGTPTVSGSFIVTFSVTDTCGKTDIRSFNFNLGKPVVITTPSVPQATYGVPYSKFLQADPSTGAYIPTTGTVWEIVSGSLPDGLTLDPATGEIKGTPTVTSGTYCFTAKVTDSISLTDTKEYCLVVADALPPVITTTTMPDGTVSFPYSKFIEATPGTAVIPTTGTVWEIVAGNLPDGLTLNPATGEVSGTPSKTGTFTFTVKVTDALGKTDTQELTITIGAEGASGTTVGTDPKTLTPNLQPGYGNACLVDPADNVCKQTVTLPGKGTFVLNQDGSTTFTAELGFIGDAKVMYRVTDANQNSVEVPIKVTVVKPAPPTILGDSQSTSGVNPVALYPVPTLVKGDGSLCLVDPADSGCKGSVTIANKGTFVLNGNGTVTFTAVVGFTGTVTVTIRVTDSYDQSDEADLNVTVNAPGAPSISGDSVTVTGTNPGTLYPFAYGNGTVCLIDPADSGCKTTVTVPNKGTFVLNDDGTVTFTGVVGFTDTVKIQIQIKDEYNQSALADLTATVNAPAGPDATGDSKTTTGVTPVDLTPVVTGATTTCLVDPDTFECKTTITVTGKGTFVLNQNGTVTFTPIKPFSGVVSIDIKGTDDWGQSASGALTVTVNKPTPPSADPTSGTVTGPDSKKLEPVYHGKGNICLVDPADNVCKGEVTIPGHATFHLNDDGTVTVTPVLGWTGTETVQLRITDEYQQSTESPVTITVLPPAPPTVDPTNGTTPPNTPIDLSPNYGGQGSKCLVDPNDNVCKQEVTLPGKGKFTLNPNGTVTFVPEKDWQGTATVQLRITDPYGQSNESPVSVTVVDTNPQNATTDGVTPVTLPGQIGVPVDAAKCLVNPETGLCGDTVAIAKVGTWKLVPGGTVIFTPVAGYVGSNTVLYRVTVGNQTSQSPYTVTVTQSAKRPPVSVTIGHFIDGSPVLTKRIQAAIKAFIKKYTSANYKNMTCEGVTEGPTVLGTDNALSKKRALNACNYVIKTLKAKLKVLKVKNKQETRVGDWVRRIRITLTD